MKVKQIQGIDIALRIYYSCPEIGNDEIRELFGDLSSSTIARYKKAVQEKQLETGVRTMCLYTIDTETAFEVWGIDVSKLEWRRKKLQKLGLAAPA